MKKTESFSEVAKSDLTKNEVILEPPTSIKQDKNLNYYCDLFGDKFIYCGIHLSTNGLKENGKPKKAPVFPYQYDKIEKSLIKNWTSKDKLYRLNGIIILNETRSGRTG